MRLRGRWLGLSGLLAMGGLLVSSAGCGDICKQTGLGCNGEGGSGGAGGDMVCPTRPDPVEVGPKDMFPEDGKAYIATDMSGDCKDVQVPADQADPEVPAALRMWKGRRLYNELANSMGTTEGTLSTFCTYTWSGPAAPPQPAVDLLPIDRAVDRRAVTPQASVQEWAHKTFMAALQLPMMEPPTTSDLRVRVIVADTEAKSGTVPAGAALGSTMHGQWMADLIREVACPPEQKLCNVEVETRLAMPLIRQDGLDTPVDNGGDFGRLHDLAAAIDAALVDWRAELETGKAPAMLVLNLSLGFQLAGDKETPADEAVKQGLRAFACHGGAIFAAAGNHGGRDSHGLLYPAAWQTDFEPTAEECSKLLGTSFYEELTEKYQMLMGNPLLRAYGGPGGAFLLSAVGAVDRGGRPIKKTREARAESECPRLVAHGLGWSGKGADRLLTGTSVSAAVVSGVFSRVAAQDSFGGLQTPYLTAHPQTISDRLISQSALTEFKDVGACDNDWFCDPKPWIAGIDNQPEGAPANAAANFPWENYPANVPSAAPHIVTINECSWRPLCEREAASSIALILPQPTDIPCVGGGCFLKFPDPNENTNDPAIFYIDPAMAMSSATLTIDSILGERTVLDLAPEVQLTSSSEAPHFTISGVTILETDRVYFSAVDPLLNIAFADQVLLVH